MIRSILILMFFLIACTSGCANPFHRPNDIPSCYFPKSNKAVEPLFRTK